MTPQDVFAASQDARLKQDGIAVRVCIVTPFADGRRFSHYTYSDHKTKQSAWAAIRAANMTKADMNPALNKPRVRGFFVRCL